MRKEIQVDQWYSDGNEHPVSWVRRRKNVILYIEDLAPLGFNLVNDYIFYSLLMKKKIKK